MLMPRRLLGRRLERIQTWTAAKRLTKHSAEVAQAIIADFQGCFRHVALSGAKQLSRTFHADLLQVLRNGPPSLLREEPAEVEWTASDLLPQLFQRRWVFQFLLQNCAGSRDPLSGSPLRPRAKELTSGRTEEKKRGQF